MVTTVTHIFLGMKKRGFGAGHYNGFGGKIEEGESIEEAAKRELREEASLEATSLEQRGVLRFSFQTDSPDLVVHVFAVTAYEGEPCESEEMRPEWFLFSDIPYDLMWPDDQYWLPLFLEGKHLKGYFRFDEPASATHQAVILEHTLEVVSEILK